MSLVWDQRKVDDIASRIRSIRSDQKLGESEVK